MDRLPVTAPLQPATGSPEEWSEALARVEDFLRAHRLHDRLRLHELSTRIVHEAGERHAAHPEQNPVTLTLHVAQEKLDRWFAAHLDDQTLPPERQSALGRMAFLACDGPTLHQQVFLEHGPLPPELLERLRRWSVRAGPNLEVSNMAPRDIDLGLVPEVAEDTWEGLDRRPLVRMALIWGIFSLVLVFLFLLSRP